MDIRSRCLWTLATQDRSSVSFSAARQLFSGRFCMGLFPSNRQAFQHAHPTADRCPTCEQPVGQDVARRIEQRRREQDEAAMAKAHAEVTSLMQQKLAEAAAAA